jgi:hypothetical protein
LIETEAPDGTDVIDRVPTNLADREVVGTDLRSGDRCCVAETRLSRVDRGASATGAVVDAAGISWFVGSSAGVKT